MCGGLGFGLVLLGETCLCRIRARLSEDRALRQPGNLRPITGDKVVDVEVH